jgi:hypothetical protein
MVGVERERVVSSNKSFFYRFLSLALSSFIFLSFIKVKSRSFSP